MLVSDLHGIVSQEAENNFVSTINGHMRTIPDFPEKGIQFHDITTVWNDPEACKASHDALALLVKNDHLINKVAAIEARGWVYGVELNARLKTGFVPIRKHDRLPSKKIQKTYGLEYGSDTIEIHVDAFEVGDRVLLVDDLIATGGSTLAAIEIIESLGGKVEQVLAISSLEGLGGRERLIRAGYDTRVVIRYPGK